MQKPIRRALISVSDKTGLVPFATSLAERGVELISTGGTAKALAASGLSVKDVSDVTGFPEMMDGRVKTLHPKVHGGLLAIRGHHEHEAARLAHGIDLIDLLVVNLYPFEATVAKAAPFEEVIENIDVGGPAMIRAAAKNHADVTVVVAPEDYDRVLSEMALHANGTSDVFRLELAQKAFARTAAYDGAISNYLGAVVDTPKGEAPGFPRTLSFTYRKASELRYGENPHQQAAFYVASDAAPGSIAAARQLQGKELSYNNIADADAALACVQSFSAKPACVIVKHANPCGVAEADTLSEAYDLAYRTDPESAFGGIIAFNRTLDVETAQTIVARQFVEVILAPDVAQGVVNVLSTKPNVRLMVTGSAQETLKPAADFKKVGGGLLVQDADVALYNDLRVVSARQPSEAELRDMIFAWSVAKFVKSNAIVYARHGATIGIGAGQMSRVNSSRIAVIKAGMAGLDIKGSAVASDAFFPFADGLLEAAAAGATAVIQPGGSIKDAEVIAAADRAGLAMIFTGMRHFRH